MRNFLFVEHHPVFGGPHNGAVKLSAPLADLGWRTIIVSPAEAASAQERIEAASAQERIAEAGVPVAPIQLHRLHASPRGNARLITSFASDVRRLRHLIRQHDARLVVCSGLENPHSAVAAHLERVPVVWQLIGTRTPMWFRGAVAPFVRYLADAVMTAGEALGKMHPGVVAFGQRWFPFYYPVDLGAFRPDEAQRARAREELGLSPEHVVVGNVGNLNSQKGHLTFIEAAAKLYSRRPDTRFVILGQSHSTHEEYERRLWRRAAELGINLGRQLVVRSPGTRVAELASAFDIFWLPSVPRSEGAPTVVGEAMALGLPVVATEVGAVREMVRDGETGSVVPPLDPDALARTTERLLNDPHLLRRMGAAGRNVAERLYAPDRPAEIHARAFQAAEEHRSLRRTRRSAS